MSDEFQLTPEEQEVETVLRSLQPAPARLKLAVEPGNVRATRRAALPRLRFWHVAAAAAIAFVFAAWFVVHHHGDLSNQLKRHWAVIARKLHGERPPQAITPPTLLAYRMALVQSPDHFDAMLARQASATSASLDQSAPATVLTLWKSDPYPSRGEL
jgi:hypothetical protein